MSAIDIDERDVSTASPSDSVPSEAIAAVPSSSHSRGPVKLTRNLSLAREAFVKGDIEKSRLAHEPKTLRRCNDDDDDCIVSVCPNVLI